MIWQAIIRPFSSSIVDSLFRAASRQVFALKVIWKKQSPVTI
jgi:hypothetical protein